MARLLKIVFSVSSGKPGVTMNVAKGLFVQRTEMLRCAQHDKLTLETSHEKGECYSQLMNQNRWVSTSLRSSPASQGSSIR